MCEKHWTSQPKPQSVQSSGASESERMPLWDGEQWLRQEGTKARKADCEDGGWSNLRESRDADIIYGPR